MFCRTGLTESMPSCWPMGIECLCSRPPLDHALLIMAGWLHACTGLSLSSLGMCQLSCFKFPLEIRKKKMVFQERDSGEEKQGHFEKLLYFLHSPHQEQFCSNCPLGSHAAATPVSTSYLPNSRERQLPSHLAEIERHLVLFFFLQAYLFLSGGKNWVPLSRVERNLIV